MPVQLLQAGSTVSVYARVQCGHILLFFGLKIRRPVLSQREGERVVRQERAREAGQAERGSSLERTCYYCMSVQCSCVHVWTPNSGFYCKSYTSVGYPSMVILTHVPEVPLCPPAQLSLCQAAGGVAARHIARPPVNQLVGNLTVYRGS